MRRGKSNLATPLLFILGTSLVLGLSMFIFLSTRMASRIYTLIILLFSVAVIWNGVRINRTAPTDEKEAKKFEKLVFKFFLMTIVPLVCTGIFACTFILGMIMI